MNKFLQTIWAYLWSTEEINRMIIRMLSTDKKNDHKDSRDGEDNRLWWCFLVLRCCRYCWWWMTLILMMMFMRFFLLFFSLSLTLNDGKGTDCSSIEFDWDEGTRDDKSSIRVFSSRIVEFPMNHHHHHHHSHYYDYMNLK
jgi:hypothetical protein